MYIDPAAVRHDRIARERFGLEAFIPVALSVAAYPHALSASDDVEPVLVGVVSGFATPQVIEVHCVWQALCDYLA